jgi:F0F1-type ATP synthase membrane subunit b/b'
VRTDAQAKGQSDYERILGNAETEVGLARQRAVEEAANRMSEIVMEVVEQVIGREVDAEAHRDLIDEAVRALQADTSGGAAAGAVVRQ